MKNFGSALLLLAASASVVISLPHQDRPSDMVVARAAMDQAIALRALPELARRKKGEAGAAAGGVSPSRQPLEDGI